MDLITLAMAKKYTDSQRIGYTERKELASFQLTPNADIGMNMGVSMGAIGLEVGKTYTVTTDSGSYTAVCKEMSGTLLLGNANFMMDALDNTGETFCVVEMDDGAGLMTVAMDANNGTHMTVSAETIVPIDPKYLPGVCLPVVKLTTVVTHGGVALNEEEIAQFEAVGAQSCIVKCALSYMEMELSCEFVCNTLAFHGLASYSAVFNAGDQNLMYFTVMYAEEEGWVAFFGIK